MHERFLKEIEEKLRELKPSAGADRWLPEAYIGGGVSRLRYLNVKIQQLRRAFKHGFSFSELESEVQWKIWEYVWHHSEVFEVMLLSSYWISKRPVEELKKHRRVLLEFAHKLDNWAHSDELSSHYARLFEHDPAGMEAVFVKWNRSPNPWLRRQSVVGLQHYSRARKRSPKVGLLLRLIGNLLDDDHYYVQKGVGWALRESWNVYPEKTYEFLRNHAHRIPPAGWTAATEKLGRAQKDELMALRKKARKTI